MGSLKDHFFGLYDEEGKRPLYDIAGYADALDHIFDEGINNLKRRQLESIVESELGSNRDVDRMIENLEDYGFASYDSAIDRVFFNFSTDRSDASFSQELGEILDEVQRVENQDGLEPYSDLESWQ